jgi:hypothetical protein
MTKLEINVDLLPDKHTEFMQSWQTFIDHVRTRNGLEGFDLKQSDLHCEITLRWENQQLLDEFLMDRWYAFITGAIKVLGKNSTCDIV